MDFFSRATSFLFLFFLHGFVARMNRRTLVRVFFFILIPSSILRQYPQSRMLAIYDDKGALMLFAGALRCPTLPRG